MKINNDFDAYNLLFQSVITKLRAHELQRHI